MKIGFFKFYGLNENSFSILYKNFGLNNRIKGFILKNNFKNTVNVFLDLTLSKKDLVLSHLFYLKTKKIKNFSYKGYKIVRGLPIFNQRTRTNARTFKRKKQKTFKSI